MLCFGDVNLLFDQARKRFERLLLQVNRSRFDYQTEMLSASLLILYMPIFVDLTAYMCCFIWRHRRQLDDVICFVVVSIYANFCRFVAYM